MPPPQPLVVTLEPWAVTPEQGTVHHPCPWEGKKLPPPFVIATPKYGINTVPTPTVAITRAWLAHDTYNYRHTRERMHGMSAPPAPGVGTVIG